MDANIPPTPEVRQVESESAMVQDLFIQHLNSGKSFNEVLDILSSDERLSEDIEIDIKVVAGGEYSGYGVSGTVNLTIGRGNDGAFTILDYNLQSEVTVNNEEEVVRSIMSSKNLKYESILIRGRYQSYSASVNATISTVTVSFEGEDKVVLNAIMGGDGKFQVLTSSTVMGFSPNVVFRDLTNSTPTTTPNESPTIPTRESVGTNNGDIPLPQARTTDLEAGSTTTQSTVPNRTPSPQVPEQITGIDNVLVVDESGEPSHAFPINTAFKLKGYPEVIMAINHRAQVLVLNIDGTVKSIPTASESAVRAMIENDIFVDFVNNRATINFK